MQMAENFNPRTSTGTTSISLYLSPENAGGNTTLVKTSKTAKTNFVREIDSNKVLYFKKLRLAKNFMIKDAEFPTS